jgi:hypothetical protein
MSYYEKYIKYKNKYLELQKIVGGNCTENNKCTEKEQKEIYNTLAFQDTKYKDRVNKSGKQCVQNCAKGNKDCAKIKKDCDTEDEENIKKFIKLTQKLKIPDDIAYMISHSNGKIGDKPDGSDSTDKVQQLLKIFTKFNIQNKNLFELIYKADGTVGDKLDGSDSTGNIQKLIKIILNLNITNNYYNDLTNILEAQGTIGSKPDGSDSTGEVKTIVYDYYARKNAPDGYENSETNLYECNAITGYSIGKRVWACHKEAYSNTYKLIKNHNFDKDNAIFVAIRFRGNVGVEADGSDSSGTKKDIIRLVKLLGDKKTKENIKKIVYYFYEKFSIQNINGEVGDKLDGSDSTGEFKENWSEILPLLQG